MVCDAQDKAPSLICYDPIPSFFPASVQILSVFGIQVKSHILNKAHREVLCSLVYLLFLLTLII